MKRMAFVPAIEKILPEEVGRMPDLEAAISYWSEDGRTAGEWLRLMEDRWGPGVLAMRRGEEVMGFVVFAPGELLPRAGRFPIDAGLDQDGVLLAYVGGSRRTRKHLLARMLRDLRHRGVSSVGAVASDSGVPWHVPTPFLLENGWQPLRKVRHRGRAYTVVRADLNNAVEVGELARGIIGRVKLPKLKAASPAPGAFNGVETSFKEVSIRR